jgi:protein-L-isoaspartate(D-aspartate) O-methyltransferase
VYTVERDEELAITAREHLRQFDLQNVQFHIGDGTLGWKDHAPYDRILVTAAAPALPQPLFAQLQEGGLMVLPVGEKKKQELLLVERRGDQAIMQSLGECVFVPLIGAAGWSEGEK